MKNDVDEIKAEIHLLVGKLSRLGYREQAREIREILDNIKTEGTNSGKRLLID